MSRIATNIEIGTNTEFSSIVTLSKLYEISGHANFASLLFFVRVTTKAVKAIFVRFFQSVRRFNISVHLAKIPPVHHIRMLWTKISTVHYIRTNFENIRTLWTRYPYVFKKYPYIGDCPLQPTPPTKSKPTTNCSVRAS